MPRRPTTSRSEPSAVTAWRRWIEELEDHPLDPFDYQAMLEARDEVAQEVEVRGDRRLFAVVDELDQRFESITTEDMAEVPWERGAGAWWSRLPADAEARSYLFRS